ncbi:MAG: hypothetical protein ABWK05_08920 [Pyrobaculum sp.]
MILKLPPRIKVLEALGALADGRVTQLEGGVCQVVSSEGDKTYKVVVGEGWAYSNDNGTLYRGYVGYPILACLMAGGKLPVDQDLAKELKDIPWRRLNELYKKYDEVLRHIYRERKIDKKRAEAYIEEVLKKLSEMKLRFREV